MDNLGRDQASMPSGFMQEDFLCFHYKAYVEHVISGARTCEGAVSFWPRGYNFYKPGRGLLDDADTEYQCSRYSGFSQEDFFMFSLHT